MHLFKYEGHSNSHYATKPSQSIHLAFDSCIPDTWTLETSYVLSKDVEAKTRDYIFSWLPVKAATFFIAKNGIKLNNSRQIRSWKSIISFAWRAIKGCRPYTLNSKHYFVVTIWDKTF